MTFIKIVESGWEGYTGGLSDVSFENGISTTEVFQHQAFRIASAINIISVEKLPDGTFVDGNIVGPLSDLIEIKEKIIEASHSLPTLEELNETPNVGKDAPPVSTPLVLQSSYTREELEKIADVTGIKGLREIADAQGIKGKSVESLIEGILVSKTVDAQLIETEELLG